MSVNDIYNRLRSAPEYHPASAELFDDFTLQAGDIISVKSGSEHYPLPIFAQRVRWTGSAMVTVQSQGEQERKPLPALQRRLFSSGRGAYQALKEEEDLKKQFYRFVEATDERFSQLMTENEWDEAAQESRVTMWSQVTQTAREVTSKVSAGDIASTINQTAQSVLIQASKIDLQGYVTASQLSAVEADIANLTAGVTVADALKATLLWGSSLIIDQTSGSWHTLTLGSVQSKSVLASGAVGGTVDFDHSHAITMTESQGVVTATLGAAVTTQAAERSANFNIADTAFYQNGVSAAYQSGYADGSAQGAAPTITAVYRDSTKVTTYNSAMYTVPIIIEFSDGSTQESTVGISITTGSYVSSTKRYAINIAGCTDRSLDASAAYNAGRDDNAGVQSLTMLAITEDAWNNQYASVSTRTVSADKRYLVTATPKYGSVNRFKFRT